MTRILLAEDDRSNMEYARQSLENDGFIVVSVDNGLQAMEALRHESFDVIILDVVMPFMDGHEVVRKLQEKTSVYAHIPVIVVTAYGEFRNEFYRLGIKDYITKPYDGDVLVESVRKYVEN